MKKTGSLKIYLDESGDFGNGSRPDFYLISFVFCDSDRVIKVFPNKYSSYVKELRKIGFDDRLPVHCAPLIEHRDIFGKGNRFGDMELEDRREILSSLASLCYSLPINIHIEEIDKKYLSLSDGRLKKRLKDNFHKFLDSKCDFIRSYSRTELWYDGGQEDIKDLAIDCIKDCALDFRYESARQKEKVLLQIADMACSLELLRLKAKRGVPWSKAENIFFPTINIFKKKFYGAIKKKLF